MSTTAARTYSENSAHWYKPDTAEACYQVPKADGKGTKVPTLADARKLNLCPSVTTILDAILRKPALEAWKTEQAVIACLTAPRKEGEELDAFVKRVLQEEQQQTQEAKSAADRGTQMHAALEQYFSGQSMPEAMMPWVMPAAEVIAEYGTVMHVEKILVGDGYAGKSDLILDAPDCWWLWDYKSTKKLPDPDKGGAWSEHRLQLSAYAQAWQDLQGAQSKPIRTGNIYISSVDEGKYAVCEHDDWQPVYLEGFAPLVTHWQWANRYRPKQGRPVARPVKATPPPEDEPPTQPAPVVSELRKHKVVWTPGVPTPTPKQA